MNAGKQSNVIAFPLERSRERAPRRTVQMRDGKFIIARAPVASTAILQERFEPRTGVRFTDDGGIVPPKKNS